MQRELLIISMLIWDLEGGEQKCHIHVLRAQVLLPQGIEVVLKEKSGVQHGTDTSKGTSTPLVLLRGVQQCRGGGREASAQLYARQK